MADLSLLLRGAGFEDCFLPLLAQEPEFKDGIHTKGYLALVDEPNLARYTLEDFTQKVPRVVSMNYTQIDLHAIKETEAESETFEAKTNVLGPGLHRHVNGLYLCHQLTGLSRTPSLVPNKLPRTEGRIAVISLQTMTEVKTYLDSLQTKNQEEKKLKVYVSHDMQWMQYKYDLTRPETLFLGDTWTRVHREVHDFFSAETEQWYKSHCIPYTRSLLFYGPPGNGKSKTIRALGSTFNLPVYVLNLAHARLDDDYLVQLVKEVSTRSLLVVEDIDRIFDHFSANTSESHISFATLLNLLDGTLTKEGIFVVMTCNDVDKLDDALKRCGRVAAMIEFKNTSAERAEEMFLSFYPGATEQAQTLGKAVKSDQQLSGATLQEHFIRKRKRPAEEACQLDRKFISKRRAKKSAIGMI